MKSIGTWVIVFALVLVNSRVSAQSLEGTSVPITFENVHQLQLYTRIVVGNAIEDFKFQPFGGHIAVAEVTGGISIWNLPTGSLQTRLAGDVGRVYGMRYSTDGRYLLFIHDRSHEVNIRSASRLPCRGSIDTA